MSFIIDPVSMVRKRRAALSTVDAYGKYVKGSPTSLSFTGNIQPSGGISVQVRPGVRRRFTSWTVYTETELLAANQFTATDADVVTYLGVDYVVMAVNEYLNGDLAHYEAKVIRADESAMAAP